MKQTVLGNLGGGAYGLRSPKKSIGYDGAAYGADFLMTEFDRTLSIEAQGKQGIAVDYRIPDSYFLFSFTITLPRTFTQPPPLLAFLDIKTDNTGWGGSLTAYQTDGEWVGYRLLNLPPSIADLSYVYPDTYECQFTGNAFKWSFSHAAYPDDAVRDIIIREARVYWFLMRGGV